MTTQNKSDTNPSWETRIEQVAKILGITPAQVESYLDSPSFLITRDPNRLEMISDENATPFGDLRKLFCEDNNVPVPKLRMAMPYLRGMVPTKKAVDIADPDVMELQRRYGVMASIDDLSYEQLIPLYKPNQKNTIFSALQKRFGDKPIIVFKPDSNEVAVEETINYITDLEDGYKEEDSYEVNGELCKIYPVGQLPNQLVNEDPLYEGNPLKRERSMFNRVNWTGISTEIRQFLRILRDRREINPDDRQSTNQLVKSSFEELKKLYPETYLTFKELKKQGDLPKLLITIGSESNAKKNNPFGINRSY